MWKADEDGGGVPASESVSARESAMGAVLIGRTGGRAKRRG